MPALESFLSLEASIASRIYNSWVRETATTRQQLIDALAHGKYADADVLVDSLGFKPVTEKHRNFLETIGLATLISGASQVTPISKTQLAVERSLPLILESAITAFSTSLDLSATEQVSVRVRKFIAELQAEDPLEPGTGVSDIRLKQFDPDDIADLINSNVLGTGKGLVDAGANLTTSRLMAYGFLSESRSRGFLTYQVTEVLDGRTCPVCRGMHGKIFRAAPALERLERTLLTTDPMQLKTMNPFPSQAAKGIKLLAGLTNTEMERRGWNTPPYHPSCRGVLVKRGTVPKGEIRGFTTPKGVPLIDEFEI